MTGRPDQWTATLTAPVTSPHPAGTGEVEGLLTRFSRALAGATADQPRWREVVVTLAVLRRVAGGGPALGSDAEAFRWKPAFVRRSLGLAALGACLEGRYRAPAEAVEPVAEQAVTSWRRTGWRTYHWEPWFSYLSPGARSVVVAESVRWATALWCALDWDRLGAVADLGGPDEQWRCPPHGAVRLRGRADVRVSVSVADRRGVGDRRWGRLAATGTRAALVVVAGGRPAATWETDLAYPALVSWLARPRAATPCRVMGLWPDTGQQRTVEVDAAALRRVAARVFEAVARLTAPPGGGPVAGYDTASVAASSVRAAFPSGLPAAVSGMSSTTRS